MIAQTETPEWMALAECAGVDPELFFPERGSDGAEAKKVCATCPVAEQCLEHALVTGEKFGVWGGASERERRKMRRHRKLAVASAVIVHGTNSGYHAHLRQGLPTCADCREAHARRVRS
jgi:WhiB family redox-sensing transcriptional regulator